MTKKRRITIEIPQELFERIIKFQTQFYLPTMTSAIIELTRRSLENEENNKSA